MWLCDGIWPSLNLACSSPFVNSKSKMVLSNDKLIFHISGLCTMITMNHRFNSPDSDCLQFCLVTLTLTKQKWKNQLGTRSWKR